MGLTNTEEKLISQMIINTSGKVAEGIVERVIKAHLSSCPHGKALFASKWALMGAIVASSLGSGTVLAVILKAMI